MWNTNGTEREIRSRMDAVQIHRFQKNYKPLKWLTPNRIDSSDGRIIRNA